MLALLHGASNAEVRMLQTTDLDSQNQTVRLGKRPHIVLLNPASWTVLQRGMANRQLTRDGHQGNKGRANPGLNCLYFAPP